MRLGEVLAGETHGIEHGAARRLLHTVDDDGGIGAFGIGHGDDSLAGWRIVRQKTLELRGVVVHGFARARKRRNVHGRETALGKPVAGAGGEGEQARDAGCVGAFDNSLEQAVAHTLAANQASEFGAAAAERIEGAAAGERAVEFRHQKVADLALDSIPWPGHQCTRLFERRDELDDATYVRVGGVTNDAIVLAANLGAGSLGGEEFLQQGAVGVVADEVSARHAAPTGVEECVQPFRGCLAVARLGALLCKQLSEPFHGDVAHARKPGNPIEHHELVCTEFHRCRRGKLGGLQGVHRARGAVAQGREQHHVARVEQGADGGDVDLARLATRHVIDAIHHPARHGGDEVATHE